MSICNKIRNGAAIIDVRDNNEFMSAHAPNSINIPLNSIYTIDDYGTFDEIIVVCVSGARAEMAKKILSTLGYNNTENAGNYGNVICN
jgi:rhodanese-related sulfurtransferase